MNAERRAKKQWDWETRERGRDRAAWGKLYGGNVYGEAAARGGKKQDRFWGFSKSAQLSILSGLRTDLSTRVCTVPSVRRGARCWNQVKTGEGSGRKPGCILRSYGDGSLCSVTGVKSNTTVYKHKPLRVSASVSLNDSVTQSVDGRVIFFYCETWIKGHY